MNTKITQDEAIQYLREMLFVIQKYRSNVRESEVYKYMPDADKCFAEMWPWVFGKNCPILALINVIDKGNVSGQTFYNFMLVFDKFMPEVKAFGEAFYTKDFPELSFKWIIDLGEMKVDY